MFSKSKINDPIDAPKADDVKPTVPTAPKSSAPAAAPKPKPSPSVLASDLTIKGNLETTGDIQIEGTVEGDIIHKTIAIESGAHFEGSVQRNDDPLSTGNSAPPQLPPMMDGN